MFRVLKSETIKRHGYDPESLVPWSHKHVVAACLHCGHIYPNKMMRSITDSKTKHCKACAPPQKQNGRRPVDPCRVERSRGPQEEKCKICKKPGCFYVHGLCTTCGTAEARYKQRMGHGDYSGFLRQEAG